MVGTGALAIWLWSGGHIARRHGRDRDPDGLADHQHGRLGGAAASPHLRRISAQVQDGMRSIAVARQMPDLPGATRCCAVTRRRDPLRGSAFRLWPRGAPARRRAARPRPRRRAGRAGRAGRAAPAPANRRWCNLLLGFLPAGERAHPDRRADIAGLTQESLRAQIGMVTQDTSLLHRSIRDNIRYGRPEATRGEIVDAARRARGARIHRRAGGLARPHAATTRMSASAASSCPAGSGSASRWRG